MSKTMQNNAIPSRILQAILGILLMASLHSVQAGEADANVIKVVATNRGSGGWSFSVTVDHPDTGWSRFTDGWDVVTEDGTVLKRDPGDPFTRLLLHPHETEQPFTRSQSGIQIPKGTRYLTVRAHDLVDGFGGKEVRIDLNTDSGPGYEIQQ